MYRAIPTALALAAFAVPTLALGQSSNVQAGQLDHALIYNVSYEPDALSLVHLNAIQSENDAFIVPITDVFRGDENRGIFGIWRVFCEPRRMAFVGFTPFTPTATGEYVEVSSPPSEMDPSDKSFAIFGVVCDENYSRNPQRLSNKTLDEIIPAFWGTGE